MRYPASEKLEIILQVEQSHLPAKRTLDMIGVPRTTFYRWYDRYCLSAPPGSRTGSRIRAGSGTVSRTRSARMSSTLP
jgi:transposase-like protein